MNVVYCQVEGSATGRSLVERNPTECGVCVIDCDQMQLYPSTPLGRKRSEYEKRKKERVKETGEQYIMRSFMHCST